MNTTMQAQIYLADQRGCSETHDFRSYHTFNFGSYAGEGRHPFGPLCLFNDDMLRAGVSLTMQAEQTMEVVLLPITGGLEYSRTLSAGVPVPDFLEPGQVGIMSLAAGMSYSVSNPYATETISFLQLWFSRSTAPVSRVMNVTTFDFSTKNTLLLLADQSGIQLYTGQYDGRQEDAHAVTSGRTVFVFVLQGTFEVANRLLHEKDGLALVVEPGYTLEFEALSNGALLLLIEMSSGH